MPEIASKNKLVLMAGIASVVVSSTLILSKIGGVWMTGSLSLLSSLLDSGLDLLASLMNLYAVKLAQDPPDHEHRFGHGKAEAIAGLGQVALILSSAFMLIMESVRTLMNPQPLEAETVGIVICIFSLLLTISLVTFQRFVAHKTNSLAIKADSAHYQVDIITNLLVMVSLITAGTFGLLWIDPVFALLMSGYMIYGCKDIFTEACNQLMDHELPDDKRQDIKRIALSHPKVPEIHDLRTRTSGAGVFIQFHISLDGKLVLKEAHDITEEVESRILKQFPHAEVFIHQDPV